ncbi:hypothetical protein IKB17_00845 [bacterium]|nr:hypothetical protein [bacterium]
MTDGIGRIFGGNNYGVGGYVPQRKGEEAPENTTAQVKGQNFEESQIDPSKVMAFLEANNLFVAPAKTKAVGVDDATENRIVNYMAAFETVYGVIAKEFGEDDAPKITDALMDRLMGMYA